jgi:hypothetical protein
MSLHVVPVPAGGEDEQGCDAFVEIGTQSTESWSILEDTIDAASSTSVEQENPGIPAARLHQSLLALFVQLIERAVRGSSIQLAVCPRGSDVGSFGQIQGQSSSTVYAKSA